MYFSLKERGAASLSGLVKEEDKKAKSIRPSDASLQPRYRAIKGNNIFLFRNNN